MGDNTMLVDNESSELEKTDIHIALETAMLQIERLLAENASLRQIIHACANALQNGAFIAPTCTVEFMAELPREIGLVVGGFRAALASARNNALDEAANICDASASNFRILAKSEQCTKDIRWNSQSEAIHTMQSYAERHETDAAAIRKLKETGE